MCELETKISRHKASLFSSCPGFLLACPVYAPGCQPPASLSAILCSTNTQRQEPESTYVPLACLGMSNPPNSNHLHLNPPNRNHLHLSAHTGTYYPLVRMGRSNFPFVFQGAASHVFMKLLHVILHIKRKKSIR